MSFLRRVFGWRRKNQAGGRIESVTTDNVEGDATADVKAQVKQALDAIRPGLQSDGGDAQLVGVFRDGTVDVHFVGACAGCPMSQMTLQTGIEATIRESVPEIRQVRAV